MFDQPQLDVRHSSPLAPNAHFYPFLLRFSRAKYGPRPGVELPQPMETIDPAVKY